MKLAKIFTTIFTTTLLCLSASVSFGQQQAANLTDLLDLVEQARLSETEEHRQRQATFQSNVNQRQALLNEMVERRETEERISVDLENTYNNNEIIKAQRFETLQERLGDLDELFGTVAGVVGDTRSQFEGSLISAQFPGRGDFLTDLAGIMGDESQLPSIEQLERLWFYLLQEMTESANVTKFNTSVAQPDGTQGQQEVVRIGSYNIVSDGQYVEYDANTKRLSILPSQPARYTDTAANIQSAAGGFTMVGIDPTGAVGGSYLAALISSPSFQERYWEQGRTIGQIIIFVGLFAALLAVERMITLSIVSAKVKRQLKNSDRPNKNNPLGRVLMVYQADANMDIETLELKLGEAILLETPPLERFLTLLKIIATVAPLGGLLGTVTGMITVFQAITLFGTGDPQIMAGGISGALVTTVLGIVVAIPTIVFHTIVKSRSDGVIQILEEQATGIIARRSEANSSAA